MKPSVTTRRDFLKKSLLAAAATTVLRDAVGDGDPTYTARVSVSYRYGRVDNAFRAMQPFKNEIAQAIGTKRVILKPNVVDANTALACSHVDWMEGILEFLKSIGKTNVVIAESTAGISQAGTKANTMYGFDNMGYLALARKYPVKFMDLNAEGHVPIKVWFANGDTTPNTTIQATKLYFDPNNFIISCPRMKTHNCVGVTAGVKNIAMSTPHVDVGMFFAQPGTHEDKHGTTVSGGNTGTNGIHGADGTNGTSNGGPQPLNDNIFRLAKVYGIHPHLSMIDGYQGMQGNGPVGGTAVAVQNLGICSFDYVAADRIAVRLMAHDNYVANSGVNFLLTGSPIGGPYPACLNYMGQAGLGVWDINSIQLIFNGATSPMTTLDSHIVVYTPQAGIINGSLLGQRATPRAYDS